MNLEDWLIRQGQIFIGVVFVSMVVFGLGVLLFALFGLVYYFITGDYLTLSF